MSRRVGIDVGGTYTDVVTLDVEGTITVLKVPSTRNEPAEGFRAALDAVARSGEDIDTVLHGTTVGTNALIERTGATCGLITTRGFRDVLELRRRDRATLYGLGGRFEPLIRRRDSYEVSGRVSSTGEIVEPLDEAAVLEAANSLVERGVECIVVGFINAYANPAHEARAAEVIRSAIPGVVVVTSSDTVAEIREFERISSAAVRAYLQPVVGSYLSAAKDAIDHVPGNATFFVTQSNGGLLSGLTAADHAERLVLSGPAAGVVGAHAICRSIGLPNAITCDIGGTSSDVAVVANDEVAFRAELEPMWATPIRTPAIDVLTIGAGGGSIVLVDPGGMLRVGPQSAGSAPGPACYGQGGLEPTVTDAHLVLGYIDPERPLGSDRPALKVDLAHEAIERSIAKPLGLSVIEAAHAILEVANTNIAAAVRSMTVEKGHDLADFALLMFGGGGPLHGCSLLRDLGVDKVVIPAAPGVLSAFGCLLANARYDVTRTINSALSRLTPDDWRQIYDNLLDRGRTELVHQGFNDNDYRADLYAEMCYLGQVHTVRVPVDPEKWSAEVLQTSFDETYESEYGYTLQGRTIVCMNVGLALHVDVGSTFVRSMSDGSSAGSKAPARSRKISFSRSAPVDTPVLDRAEQKPGTRIAGPAVFDQPDCTVVIEPGVIAVTDSDGNLILQLGAEDE